MRLDRTMDLGDTDYKSLQTQRYNLSVEMSVSLISSVIQMSKTWIFFLKNYSRMQMYLKDTLSVCRYMNIDI